MRRRGPALEASPAAVAEAQGLAVEEIALTRGATEALQKLTGGYNKLGPGGDVTPVRRRG